MRPSIVIITGPTASGKSALALSLAENSGGVIINADSQQLYRELRILTARPTEAEEQKAPHRLYGTLPASTACSAGQWLNLARMEIDWALKEGKTAIVCGGTGLYLKALAQGIADVPDIAPDVRQQAESDYDQMGKDAFSERLKWVDPEFFTRLTAYDRQRLIRAYSVWLGSGKSLSYWQSQPQTPPYDFAIPIYTTTIDRDTLYARCNARFDAMLGQGALEEVKLLLTQNLPASLPAMKSVGVPELSAYLRGEITLEAAAEKAKQATRNYAKRQLTWLRNQFPQAILLEHNAKTFPPLP